MLKAPLLKRAKKARFFDSGAQQRAAAGSECFTGPCGMGWRCSNVDRKAHLGPVGPQIGLEGG